MLCYVIKFCRGIDVAAAGSGKNISEVAVRDHGGSM